MDTKRMRACAPLLPAPGDRVVVECIDKIESLQSELDTLRAQLARYREAADRWHCIETCGVPRWDRGNRCYFVYADETRHSFDTLTEAVDFQNRLDDPHHRIPQGAAMKTEQKDPYLYLPSDSGYGFDIFRRGHGGTILIVQNADIAGQICALMNKDYFESRKELT